MKWRVWLHRSESWYRTVEIEAPSSREAERIAEQQEQDQPWLMGDWVSGDGATVYATKVDPVDPNADTMRCTWCMMDVERSLFPNCPMCGKRLTDPKKPHECDWSRKDRNHVECKICKRTITWAEYMGREQENDNGQ